MEQRAETLLDVLPKDKLTPFKLPPTLMDDQTYDLVEIPRLFDAMDTTVTQTGKFHLYRSLRQPLTITQQIKAKQQAVVEVGQNDKLRKRLEEFTEDASNTEPSFYQLLQKDYNHTTLGSATHPNLYDSYKGAKEFLKFITAEAKSLTAESAHLRAHIDRLTGLSETQIFDWLEGSVHSTPKGLKSDRELPWFMPNFRFYPTDYKSLRYLYIIPFGPAVGACVDSGISLATGEPFNPKFTSMGTGMGMGLSVINAPLNIFLGREYDNDTYVKPIAEKYAKDPAVQDAVDSLGAIEELLVLNEYKDGLTGPVVQPTVFDAKHHSFRAKGLRNPLLALENRDYIPNDVDLEGVNLTFITGPVSGGKTSYCKTIAQAQVLAQIGSYIPAESAEIAATDKVFYHSPMINELGDREGRFGTEVARVKDLFFASSPRSLVMFDELLEATTAEERLKHSIDIMDAFGAMGNNTLLITHNHELAKGFARREVGQFLMVQFDGRNPTHKLVPGISTESHSDEVMERQGMTRKEMFDHLRRQGYIN